MNIETAENIWSEHSITFEISGHTVSKHKITEMLESAETIIAARDQRIEQIGDRHIAECERLQKEISAREQRIAELEAELKKTRSDLADKIRQFCSVIDERDESRRDALEMASLLKTSAEQLCLERGGVVNEYGAYNIAVQMINKCGEK